ncbi:four-carbon acid sugar kinase family protein [Mycobacterium sp. 21AC1]|uniref:3-oxo-tetronate kinase n=1 Tax=[Mycobacterium] appelbergii TaxID=2939269 RepID=UPI002938D887|nr:3-oxo-tetronate kinase [Mycobacterium sp. 21AC1]MDV3123940.1 four-carbon acid sugar kinase family protein [Mycobacterium sp. 21AC1]
MSRGPKIGCIADDYTGGTDVAAALRRQGLRTVLLFGAPGEGALTDECDAVVVALKSRALDAEAAVAMSLAAQHWLTAVAGVPTVYFKYCSTFDSTAAGNIGPVTDALLAAARAPLSVVCPATPEHGRTVYQGHLFVADQLLSESSMRHHPLTPMTDSYLPRLMAAQSPHPVKLIGWQDVRRGGAAIADALRRAAGEGVRHVVLDALDDDDLLTIAGAVAGMPVITGAAGLAGAVGHVIADHDQTEPAPPPLPAPAGASVVFAGSCSKTTLEQVAHARGRFASLRLDPRTAATPADLLGPARAWLLEHLGDEPVMIYSSAPADERGPADPDVANQLEATMGALAKAAVAAGARRVVVAGGETSGAVVDALEVKSVVVDAEADRGVPWCSTSDPRISLLLKSGNFGRPDLLVRAATSRTLS